MQDEINNNSKQLLARAAKLAKDMLAKLLAVTGRKVGNRLHRQPHSKLTMKKLARQNAGLSSIEINTEHIRSFEKLTHRYGVDFALRRDTSTVPHKYRVFFKARDADALQAVVAELTAKVVKKPPVRREAERPSVLAALREAKLRVKQPAVLARNKNKELAI